jgi:hypothetical protein
MIYIPIVLVTAVVAAVVAFCLLLGAAVPQWYMVSPDAIAFGLQTYCVGTDCDTIPYNNLATGRSPGEWKNRELTTEVLVWVSLVFGLIVTIVMIIALAGKIKFDSKGKWIALLIMPILAAVFLFVALMIYAGTYDSWLNNGDHFCDLLNAGPRQGYECGFGASFIVGVLTVILHILVAVAILLRMLEIGIRFARTFDVAILILSLATFALTIAVGVTNRWLVSALPNVHMGVFQACIQGESCETYGDIYPNQISFNNPTTCSHDTGDWEDRNNAIGALMIIGFFAMLAVSVIHFLRQFLVMKERFSTVMRIVFTIVSGVITLLVFIALILFASTWNSWVGCGETFCEMMGNASSTCNLGFAFAMGMTGFLLLVILLALLIWDLIGCLRESVAFTEPGEAVSNDPYYHRTTTTTTAGGSSSYSRTTRTTTTTTKKTTTAASSSSRGRNDWEYQPDSGYYWSDSRHVYWDKASNQYYDPKTDRWSHAA